MTPRLSCFNPTKMDNGLSATHDNDGGPPGPLVAYLRVSTDTQANDGGGLDDQRAAIEAWAASQNPPRQIIAWHTDAGESGSNGLDKRKGLAKALRAIDDGEATGLVVARLDRLSRDQMAQESLLRSLWQSGAEVHSTVGSESDVLSDDPKDPGRRLLRTIMGAVAEYERATIRLRLEAGRARKHAAGGFAYGRPPYGWRSVNKQLVPDEEEQIVVRLLRRLRVEGFSYRDIARQLNEGGILRHGRHWHSEQVRRALDAAQRLQNSEVAT